MPLPTIDAPAKVRTMHDAGSASTYALTAALSAARRIAPELNEGPDMGIPADMAELAVNGATASIRRAAVIAVYTAGMAAGVELATAEVQA